MPAIFWFFIAFLLLGTALMVFSPIVANKKLMHDIKPLWSNKRPLETFIRPNHTIVINLIHINTNITVKH